MNSMNRIKTIIVDDEPIARQIVRNYCEQIDSIDIVAECENALEASKLLSCTDVDLLFLDINMPILNGLSLLKSVQKLPDVIITTAYKDYALDAFELNVLDYLLKPFSFERFFSAVQKFDLKKIENNPDADYIQQVNESGIFFKIGKVIYRFQFDKILFLEAQQNYTRIVTETEDIKIYKSLSHIELELPPRLFLRTHRSFIINKNMINKIDGNIIHINRYEVPIGANYKEGFIEGIGYKGM
jgi:DNA-binding LytR/AlgR family response regulator